MYGDFEAHRHWMEVTFNLASQDWYRQTPANDLQYWGLDYPPLMAYQSRVLGAVANAVDPDAVWLTESENSHGFQAGWLTRLMRGSVLLVDVLLYAPAAWLVTQTLVAAPRRRTAALLVVLCQPALLLIDHGHFQYNNGMLGFMLFALAAMLREKDFIAAVMFVGALNYKQMALYYALAVFVYLLRRCSRHRRPLLYFAALGMLTLATFYLTWLPFTRSLQDAVRVLLRLFPVARGLFEDKVANAWCVAYPVLKRVGVLAVDNTALFRLATSVTLLALLPSCVLLWRCASPLNLVYALAVHAQAFFLFSFQVHEKTILLPLLPIALLYPRHPRHVALYSLVATFSMLPLLLRDNLLLPYLAIMLLFAWFAYTDDAAGAPVSSLHRVSLACMLVLHVVLLVIPPPTSLPHLWVLVVMAYCFLHFAAAYLWLSMQMVAECRRASAALQQKKQR